MKRILVTGCNGFVAQDIINELIKEYEVYGIGRYDKPVNSKLNYVVGDILNRETLFENIMNQVESFDALIHVAAYLGNDVQTAYNTNCYGTQNIVDLAKKTGCKVFVLISGIPIIGKIDNIPIDEKHLNCPESVYHRTKYLSEIICQTALEGDIRCVVLRIASPVGKEIPKNKVFSTFVQNAMNNLDLNIYGSGERIQNYIDTRDVGRAVKLAITSKKAKGMYILSGNSVSDIELANRVIDFFQSNSKIKLQKINTGTEEKWLVCDKKAKEELGYQATFSLEDSFLYVAEGMVK